MLWSLLHAPGYPPTASDWRRYQDVITNMYIERDMSLKEIRCEMNTRYMFKASPRMYKQRFKEWQLYKNNCAGLRVFQRADTKDMAPNMSTPNNEDGDMMTILINTRCFVEVALQRQPTFAATLCSSQPGNQFDEFCCFEDPVAEESALEDTWDMFYYGLTLLCMHDYISAKRCFNRACDSARATLLVPTVHMFRRLLMVLGTLRWTSFEQYRQFILDYTAKLAFTLLGRHHPTFIILQQLRKGNCLERAAEAILKCSHDLLEDELGSGHAVVLRFKRGISVILRRQKDYQSSESFIRKAISDSEAHNGFHNKETRDALQRLANLYIHQNRYGDAEKTYIDVLSRGFSSAKSQGESLDEASIRTLRSLSCLAWLRGQQHSSLEWAQHEVNAALQRWGPEQIRLMVAQTGYVQVAQASSDEECARQLLDLCEPIWSFWGAAKSPATIFRAEEFQMRLESPGSGSGSAPLLQAIVKTQVRESGECGSMQSPLPTNLLHCDYHRALEHVEASPLEYSFGEKMRRMMEFRYL